MIYVHEPYIRAASELDPVNILGAPTPQLFCGNDAYARHMAEDPEDTLAWDRDRLIQEQT